MLCPNGFVTCGGESGDGTTSTSEITNYYCLEDELSFKVHIEYVISSQRYIYFIFVIILKSFFTLWYFAGV